mgnify:CR=1 FL=1
MEKLYSEKLREKYGEVFVEIIRQDATIRESYLVDKKKTAYHYAIVFFGPDFSEVKGVDPELPLGEALKSIDYKIKRQHIDSFMVSLSKLMKKKFKTEKKEALAKTIRLIAQKGHNVLDIGRIVEVYNPEFK